MNGTPWSYTLVLVAIYKRFTSGHLTLLRMQDKKNSADGDIGVSLLPNNFRSNNIRVESMQIQKKL
jgi:hypothetical protein